MHWTPLSGANFEDVFGPQGKSARSRIRKRVDAGRAKAKPRVESLEHRVTPALTANVIASSLASTQGTNVTIGEVVRMRVVVERDISGAYDPTGYNVWTNLAPGLQLLPDSVTMALVSDQGISSSLDPTGTGGLNQTGNDSNFATVTPTFLLPPGAITNDPATGAVFFHTGITNSADADPNNEYVIIEFNALVTNVAGNQAETPTQLNGQFQLYIENQPCDDCVAGQSVTVVEPQITDLTKTAQVNTAGDTVAYTVTFSNTGNSTAYDVRVVDNLPADLTFDPSSVSITGGTGPTDRSNSTTLDVTFDSVAVGGQVTITYRAAIPVAARTGQPINNTVDLDYTSLPGPNGTSPNPTGSDTPGASGDVNGERDGSGGVNDYNDTANANIAVSQPNSLAGFVYLDVNHSGDFDAGDTFIQGAVISLQDSNGNPVTDLAGNVVGPITTGADGQFSFTNLANGNYQLVEDYDEAAHMYMDGLDDSGLINGVKDTTAQSDAPPGDRIFDIQLNGGDVGVNYRFGECPCPVEISGHVYFDFDCNGVFSTAAGDHPLAGVTVQLTDAAGNPVLDFNGNAVAAVTTDANGFYQFTNLLPGTYQVHEVQPTDATLIDGADVLGTVGGTTTGTVVANDTFQVPLNAGDMGINFDFFECPTPALAQLSGHVYFDFDCNGVFSAAAGDHPLPGVTIQLFDGTGAPVLVGGVAVTTTTDVNGFYQFTNLAAGTYQAHEVQPTDPDLVDGADVPGTVNGAPRGTVAANDTLQVPLNAGDAGINFDFFECPRQIQNTAQLSGFVYEDFTRGVFNAPTKDNGIFETAERGIAGVTVMLFDAAGTQIGQTTTDATGFYQFTGLAPGTYRVVETQPPVYQDGKDTFGTTGGVVGPNQGIGTDFIDQIPLVEGGNSQQNNFGELFEQLSGNVYEDFTRGNTTLPTFNNGSFDAGELGIPGATVTAFLETAGGLVFVATTTTGANGEYFFTDPNAFLPLSSGAAPTFRAAAALAPAAAVAPPASLSPGEYAIVETQPAGYVDGKDTPGTGGGNVGPNQGVGTDFIENITLALAADSVNNNFGELPLNQLSGFVYFDQDCNGIKDGTDQGIAGVSVQLTDLNGNAVTDVNGNVIGIVQTDATGFYQFLNLPTGTYRVTELPPQPQFNGLPTVDGLDTAGTVNGVIRGAAMNDVITNVALAGGETSINNNFGECRPNLAGISIAGNVYFDQNKDCVFNTGDFGVGGVRVHLFRTDLPGGPVEVAQQTTNPSGAYLFQVDNPGTYMVVEDAFGTLIKECAVPGTVNGQPRGTAAGTDDLTAITLNNDEAGVNYNFFLTSNLTPPPFSKQQLLANASGGGAGGTGVNGVSQFATDPSFANINRTLPTTQIMAVGADAGGGPEVRVFNFTTGQQIRDFYAYDPNFTGGVRVAIGDVNGDGTPDVITAPGGGGGPEVKVFDGATGAMIRDFYAYDPSFTGGVFVAAADVNGDGLADIITGAGAGGGPHVQVFNGNGSGLLASFYAYGGGFAGGVSVAGVDLNLDGKAEVITGAGPGGGAHVRVFNGATIATPTVISEFMAFDPGYTGGVTVAANSAGHGDLTGDGRADFVVGTMTGPGRVQVINGQNFAVATDFIAYDGSLTKSGVHLGVFDINGDARADIVAGAGGAFGSFVRVLDVSKGGDLEFFQAFNPAFLGGAFVSAG